MAVADQVPTDSGFVAKTDGADVIKGIDLAGKTAIVTGGYSGIGLETVRALVGAGVNVVVPARSREKAETNLAEIDGDVRVSDMDLGDIGSVTRFAEEMTGSLDTLDILINNAGIMANPLTRVGPGWESQFGTNHMGHFALTLGLMPLLEKTPGARVVALASTAHKVSDVHWDDIQFENHDYDKWQAYGQAKTANALFANALSRRMRDSDGLAFAVHPGGIFTPLQRHLPLEEQVALGWLNEDGSPSDLAKMGFKTPAQGCSTSLWAATSPKLDGKPGVYCEDCDIAAPTDTESPMARYSGVDAHACSDENAEKLWAISEKLLDEA
ncbi:SDR family NAD(P)-dependent oxidoreductase [Parasphingopyxis sp. CP4]|uniref:oxidoreductase n=1 Tax=Parasphingopyxis sp. CP4 TaxID=2724527 RepID=UPI0015A26786|nr:oxidoreductase [Parasphingopyxis sp. CP4]QLC22821.1 SDR family NAD(P)-dependent oxidoreductase [Parasphingopyxis sp. CP4]